MVLLSREHEDLAFPVKRRLDGEVRGSPEADETEPAAATAITPFPFTYVSAAFSSLEEEAKLKLIFKILTLLRPA